MEDLDTSWQKSIHVFLLPQRYKKEKDQVNGRHITIKTETLVLTCRLPKVPTSHMQHAESKPAHRLIMLLACSFVPFLICTGNPFSLSLYHFYLLCLQGHQPGIKHDCVPTFIPMGNSAAHEHCFSLLFLFSSLSFTLIPSFSTLLTRSRLYQLTSMHAFGSSLLTCNPRMRHCLPYQVSLYNKYASATTNA